MLLKKGISKVHLLKNLTEFYGKFVMFKIRCLTLCVPLPPQNKKKLRKKNYKYE